MAVREAAAAYATGAKPDRVFFGLAVSLPDCIIKRGVGEEALEYCLAHGNLSPDDLEFVFGTMSRPRGPNESLRAAHRRISDVALRAGHVGHYYNFLRHNIDELVEESRSGGSSRVHARSPIPGEQPRPRMPVATVLALAGVLAANRGPAGAF